MLSRLKYSISINMEWITMLTPFVIGILGIINIIVFLCSLILGGHTVLQLAGILFAAFLIIYWAYVSDCWEKYGACPLFILSQFGFFGFFRACKLRYKKKFWEAMVVYLGYYPCIAIYIFYFFYIL